MKLLGTAAVAAALGLPAAVSAQSTLDLPEDVVDGFSITLTEIRANSEAIYSAFAGADDGPISRQEFISKRLPESILPSQSDGQLLEKLFAVLDVDGDEQMTQAEWNQRLDEDLTFADENEDGRITLKELANARENLGFGDTLSLIF